MGKSLAKAGAIIAGAALIATGIGAAAGVGLLGSAAASVAASSGTLTLFGVSVATLGQVGAGLTALGSLTTKRPDVQTGGNPTQQTYDPQAGIPYPMGRTAVGGRIVYGTTAPANNKYRLFYSILGGGGPIDGIEAFYANNELVSFTADGGEGASGKYLNRMWQVRRLGAPGESYLRFTATGSKDTPADHGGNPPEWTSAHKFTGYAAALTACEYDAKIYAGDVQPLWVLRGVKVYDPRLDDTYPGGSGSCRALDESTYVYSTNPWLHALTFALGRWQNGKRVIGLGLPVSAIIVSQFVEAANVAEANGWQIGGVVYTSDVRMSAVQAMAQAGGGYCLPMGAQLGCVVNAPRVSIGEIRSRDIVGDSSAAGTKSRRDRINRIIGRYRSEAHNWEVVSAAPVEVSEHVAFDGGPRTREIDYTLVQGVDQVAQLARYDIENSRELEPLTFTLGPAFLGYRAGDCLTVNVPELGLVDQDVIVQLRSFDPATGAVTLVCRSETQAKHAYCLGQTGEAPPTPSLTPGGYAPTPPDAADWSAEGGVVATADGEVPVIIIRGIIDDVHADTVIVDYRQRLEAGPPAVYGDWTSREFPASSFAASGSDPTVTLQLTGLAPGGVYQVRVRYKTVRGVQDPAIATDLGHVTTGGLVAGDTKFVGTRTVAQVNQALDDLSPVTEAAEELADFVKNTAPYVTDLKDAVATANAEAKASAYATIQTAIGAAKAREAIIASSYVDGKKPKTYALEVRGVADNAITQVAALGVVVDDNMAQVSEHIALQIGINEATASTLETVEAAVADNKATYDAFVLAQTSTNTATVEALTALTAEVDNNEAGFTDYTKAQADINEATASTLTALKADVDDNKATYDSFVTTQVDLNASLANATTALASDFADFAGEVATSYATKSYADGAVSSYDTTLKTWNTSKDNPLFVIADTTVNTVTDIMGNVYGSAGFGINAGGAIASVRAFASGGFAETSLVRIQADRFQIQAGTESATTGLTPFTYDAATGTLFVNNVTLRRGNIQGAAIATALGFDWTGGVTLTASNAAVGPGQAVTISDGVADIFIDVFLYAENTAPSSGQDVTVKLYKDGSLFKQRFFKIGIENQGHINFPVLDLGVTGSHTYSLEATATPGTGGYCTATAAVLRLMPLFRTGT